MENTVKSTTTVDENRLMEIQSKNNVVMQKAEDAVLALEEKIKRKHFDAEGDEVLQEVEHHGLEVSRALRWYLEEFIGPIVDAAHKTWKQATERRKMIADPLEAKKQRAALAAGTYRRLREEQRRQKEEALAKELKRQEEERLLNQAVEAEKGGAHEEASHILEQPVATPVVVLPSAPATKGASVRTNWKFRIVDESKIPREYMQPNETMIGQTVRASQGKIQIAGIEIFSEDKSSFSSR